MITASEARSSAFSTSSSAVRSSRSWKKSTRLKQPNSGVSATAAADKRCLTCSRAFPARGYVVGGAGVDQAYLLYRQPQARRILRRHLDSAMSTVSAHWMEPSLAPLHCPLSLGVQL